MTLTELADRVDLTVVNLSILKNGRARAIRFSTLARSRNLIPISDLRGGHEVVSRLTAAVLTHYARARHGREAMTSASPFLPDLATNEHRSIAVHVEAARGEACDPRR